MIINEKNKNSNDNINIARYVTKHSQCFGGSNS